MSGGGLFLLWKSVAVRRMAATALARRGDPTHYWEWAAKVHLALAVVAVAMVVGGLVVFFVRLW